MPSSPTLPVARFQLRFIADSPIRFPEYAGSAWRGVFGRQLKQAVCVTRNPSCRDCLLYRSCAYPYIFETPPPANAVKMRRYPSAPHPFVIEPEVEQRRELQSGNEFGVEVGLFGKAIGHLPYFVHAFSQAGRHGIGTGQGRFSLARVLRENPVGMGEFTAILTDGGTLEPIEPVVPVCPSAPCAVRIRFETPLRLKQYDDLVGPNELQFHHLLGSVLRRISMLTYFHTETPYETDFRSLLDSARDVELRNKSLRWRDWTRYSSRQQTSMQMGGLVGTVEIEDDIGLFWPLLWLGQWAHAGKGTSMGLGRYRVSNL